MCGDQIGVGLGTLQCEVDTVPLDEFAKLASTHRVADKVASGKSGPIR